MSRQPIPLHPYSLVVVRRDDGRFLLMQEKNDEQGWYLPAGRVDPGERFEAAAVRETLEETGVPVRLTGLLRIEHDLQKPSGAARLRMLFVAVPVDDTPPKTHEDEHSLRAGWFTLDEVRALKPLRHVEALQWCERVAAGAVVAPLSVLA